MKERNQVKVSEHPTSAPQPVDNQAAALAPLGCPRTANSVPLTAESVDEMRERNRLAYQAQLREQSPDKPDEYQGSDALSARRRAAKQQIRQTLAEARAARQNPEETR